MEWLFEWLDFVRQDKYLFISLGVGSVLLVLAIVKRFREDTWDSHLLPHDSLKEIFPEKLWKITGSYMPPRNMIIYKMNNGKLLIHSAIVVDERTMKKILDLGELSIMVVPNIMHRLDAAVYKKRFPNLKVLAPLKAKKKVEEVVKVDEVVEDFLESNCPGVRFLQPEGIKPGELAYEVDLGEKRIGLLFTDLLFNLPPREGIDGLVGSILGSIGDGQQPFVPRLFRWMGVTDTKRLRKWFLDISEKENIALITVSHGNAATSQCSVLLKKVAETL